MTPSSWNRITGLSEAALYIMGNVSFKVTGKRSQVSSGGRGWGDNADRYGIYPTKNTYQSMMTISNI